MFGFSNTSLRWLRGTGQYWNYLAFWLLILTSALSFGLLVSEINSGEHSMAWYAAISMAIACAAYLWLGASIKCRQCKQHVAWWFLTHSSLGSWLTDLRHIRDDVPFAGMKEPRDPNRAAHLRAHSRSYVSHPGGLRHR